MKTFTTVQNFKIALISSISTLNIKASIRSSEPMPISWVGNRTRLQTTEFLPHHVGRIQNVKIIKKAWLYRLYSSANKQTCFEPKSYFIELLDVGMEFISRTKVYYTTRIFTLIKVFSHTKSVT